jgi:hypothetical protein
MALTCSVGNSDFGASAAAIRTFCASGKRPLFHTPGTDTRRSRAASIACKPPQDCPMTAI